MTTPYRPDPLQVLKNVQGALQHADELPNGPINDTIWYSDHETLFDYIAAAIDLHSNDTQAGAESYPPMPNSAILGREAAEWIGGAKDGYISTSVARLGGAVAHAIRQHTAALRTRGAVPSEQPTAHFGLASEQIDKLKASGLKPEEIAGDDPGAQLQRVRELIWWFARFADGHANPKWLRGHAFELVYYIACMDVKQGIDLHAIKNASYLEGVNISASDRRALEHLGVVTPAAPMSAQGQDAIDMLSELIAHKGTDSDIWQRAKHALAKARGES